MYELVAMKTAITKSGREAVSHFIGRRNRAAADKRAGRARVAVREIIESSRGRAELTECFRHRF